MKKLFFFAASLLVAGSVMADVTLDNSKAVLAGDAIKLTAGIIEWDDQEDPTQQSATWTEFLDAGQCEVVVNQTTGSGHNFKMTVKQGSSEIGSVSEGGDSWDEGELSLGSFNISTKGVYTLILTNQTQWSSANAVSVTLKGAAATGMKDVKATAPVTKKMIDGKMMIMRDGKAYNVLGF